MSNHGNETTRGLNDPSFEDGAPSSADELNAAEEDSRLHAEPSINSINAPLKGANKAVRALIVVLVIAAVGGLGAFFAVNWLNRMKEVVRESSQHRKGATSADSANSLNPEAPTRVSSGSRARMLGADGGALAPAHAASGADGWGGGEDVRPIRDANGNVVLNPTGKAMGVDASGHVVEVPAIGTVDGTEPRGKRPLPGQSNVAGVQKGGAAGGGQPEKKPPSRYGGSILADGLTTQAMAQAAAASEAAAAKPTAAEQRTNDLLRMLVQPHGQDSAPSTGSASVGTAGGQDGTGKASSGPVGSQMNSSRTPVAVAARMKDQTLLLPKNRQGDCILTTKIINELAGFTSCTLTQNLYGADGKVVLLERGSEVSGEYGVSNQAGQRRLFIVWTRVRTPEGVEVDLESPAADPLGTSGVPGYLEQRWTERIGAALLLSVMKDTITLAMAAAQPSQSAGSVVVTPGQNTIATGQDLAEQVLKQTINVKPTLYINEGSRVSIFVARDLDFSSVYKLSTVGAPADNLAKATQ